MQRGDRTQVRDSESKCFITGATFFSSMAGMEDTSDLPSVTRCLAKYVSQLSAKHTFATVAFFRNLQAKPHADAQNLIAPLSAFKGGHLWVADGVGPVARSIDGTSRQGWQP